AQLWRRLLPWPERSRILGMRLQAGAWRRERLQAEAVRHLVWQWMLRRGDAEVLQGNTNPGRRSLLRARASVLRPGLPSRRHALLSQFEVQVRGRLPVLSERLGVLPGPLLSARKTLRRCPRQACPRHPG